MRFFVLISMLLCICACDATPQFKKDDLKDAKFEFYQADGRLQTFAWNDFKLQDQEEFSKWLTNSPINGRPNVVTYAPNVIIRTKQFTVNFTEDTTVCNYNSNSNRWKQIVRAKSKADETVRQCIIRMAQKKNFNHLP